MPDCQSRHQQKHPLFTAYVRTQHVGMVMPSLQWCLQTAPVPLTLASHPSVLPHPFSPCAGVCELSTEMSTLGPAKVLSGRLHRQRTSSGCMISTDVSSTSWDCQGLPHKDCDVELGGS